MRSRLALSSLALIALIGPSTADALDDSRRGFFFGLGAGPGIASNEVAFQLEPVTLETDRETDFSIATDLRAGVGVSEQTVIYGFTRYAWNKEDLGADDSVTLANGITGVGLSHFVHPLPPSFYWSVGAGVATWSAPFEDNTDTWVGPGFLAGLGYQFSPLWSLEGTGMWGRPGDDAGPVELESDSYTALVTLSATIY
jgi:hypothetical protein